MRNAAPAELARVMGLVLVHKGSKLALWGVGMGWVGSGCHGRSITPFNGVVKGGAGGIEPHDPSHSRAL